MRITSAGNVGIGTSSPVNYGAAYPNLTINGSTTGVLDIQANGTTQLEISTGANLAQISAVAASGVLVFTSGGNTERMRIDSSGNVGIGVTPTTWTNGRAIEVSGTNYGLIALEATNATSTFRNWAISSNYNNAGELNFIVGASQGAKPSTIIGTFDSSGNLGLGTSSPYTKLDVSGATGLKVYYTGGTDGNSAGSIALGDGVRSGNYVGMYRGTSISGGSASLALSLGAYDAIRFCVETTTLGSQTERMRIDSSGNLLVNTTSQFSSAKVTVSTTATTGIASIQSTTGGYCFLTNALVNSGTYYHINFQENGTQRGSITSNGTVTVYATTSDYRLKENVKPMVNALATVSQLKPVTYDWTESKINGQGFIAHELQAVIPDAVVGLKDDIDSEGNPIYQQIDTSVLVATLTAAIQELKAEFDAYKATHP